MSQFVSIPLRGRTDLVNINFIEKLEPAEDGKNTLVFLRSGDQLQAITPYERLSDLLRFHATQTEPSKDASDWLLPDKPTWND